MRLSTRNQFPGTVVSITKGGAMAVVKVAVDGTDLIVTAAVTRDAVEDLGLVQGATPVAGPGAADDARDDADELYAALARLPERQRRAVAYHHLGGVPHAEVAVIVGSTPAAVRRASADGIAALRRHLRPSDPAPPEGAPR